MGKSSRQLHSYSLPTDIDRPPKGRLEAVQVVASIRTLATDTVRDEITDAPNYEAGKSVLSARLQDGERLEHYRVLSD